VARFVLRRLLWALFLFVAATLVTYLIFFVIPGDPALIAAGSGAAATPQFLAHVRHELHLDLPIYQQYWLVVWNMVRHGSLGYSFRNGASVRWVVGQDAPVTASLVLGGAVGWLAISIPLGILSAVRQRSPLDRAGMAFVLVGVSAPAVWIGLILAYVFGFELGWTPIAGYCNFFPSGKPGDCSGPGQWAYHLILPWLTFMFAFAALYARLIRSSVLEAMTEDYVRTARAKGLPGRAVVVKHALRNAALPIVTMIGIEFGTLLGGTVITETVFAWPGLGRLAVEAINSRDFPVVQTVVLLISATFVTINVVVDLLYRWLDPRVDLA
jgi:peptide/nickel transport system permease protein